MSFIWPAMLLLLLIIPLFIVVYIRLQHRRQRLAASFSSLGFVPGVGRGRDIRRHIPPALFLLGLTLLAIAMARPQTVVSLPRAEVTVILAFDISGSMAADDLKPTRMEAAKSAAREFVQRQPSRVQIGVVAFSDGGLSVLAPTNDQEAILASIEQLTPQRSTSIAQGILASLNTIDKSSGQSAEAESNITPTPVPEGTHVPAVIVLLTDGENTAPPDPIAAAQTAAERGVSIYTVGIGSATGATINVNGFNIHTQLDEVMLQQISQITDGEYFNAQNEQDIHEIYENLDPQVVIKSEKMEVTSILAGASIFILLIGGIFSLSWFSRFP